MAFRSARSAYAVLSLIATCSFGTAVGCTETFRSDGPGDGGSGANGNAGGDGSGGTNGSGSATGSGSGSGTGGAVDAPVDCELEVPGCVIDFAGSFGEPVPFTNLLGVTSTANKIFVTHSHQVSEIDIATGGITLLAGSGSGGDALGIGNAARFATPTGIVAHNGFLYVSDLENKKIKRVSIATGKVDDYLTNSQGGLLTTPRGLAIEPGASAGDGYLLIADSGSHTIIRVAIGLAAPAIVAPSVIAGTHKVSGNGEDNLNEPYDLAVIGTTAYIADRANNKIRSIDLTVVPGANNPIPLEDVWGNGTAGYAEGSGTDAILNGPTGISTAGERLAFTDSGNFVLRGGIPGEEVMTIAGTAGNQEHQVGGGKNAGFNAATLAVHFHSQTTHTFILEGTVVRRMSPPN